MKVTEVQPLEGWITFPEAAELLGVSNQAVHKMVFDAELFPGVRSVGGKPLYVLPLAEVRAIVTKRNETTTEQPSTHMTPTLVSPDEVLTRSLA